MTDYNKLVEALRYDRGQYEKGYADGRFDAADRIGALMEENKMLLNTIPADKKLMLDHIRKLEQQLPKRGEWVLSKERMRPDMCSVCGCVYEADRFMDKIAWNYCPNCGAKMTGEQDVE